MSMFSEIVSLINDVTLDLEMQAQGAQQVTHKSYSADGGVGAPTYPTVTKRNAVVEKRQRNVRSFSGQLVVSHTTVTFLVPPFTAKEHDIIMLADGSSGEVVATGGPVDASGQLINEIYLG